MKPPDVQIIPIVSQMFEENAYLVYAADAEGVVVVDPGLEPLRIVSEIERIGRRPAAVLNTHGHGDHIAGNAELKRRWPDCPIVIGEHEAHKLTDPTANLSEAFGLAFTSPPADRTVADGDFFEAAGLRIGVREIPGHSAGHVVYVIDDLKPLHVLVGDVIFAGSVGRTDFFDGSFSQLAAGIRSKLFSLPDDTVLWPGHGPPTTVGEEKRSNPFVGGS
ncbi:MAG: MBL fold metallo-hydrolase [Planctomycetota bacterium]